MDPHNGTQPDDMPTHIPKDYNEATKHAVSHHVSTPGTSTLVHENEPTQLAPKTKHETNAGVAQTHNLARDVEGIPPDAAANTESVTSTDQAVATAAASQPAGKVRSDTQDSEALDNSGSVGLNQHEAPQDDEPVAVEASPEAGRLPTGGRPDSLLVSTLTHPNGADMFPSLSATEQEQMSWEAFTQAEESIVAEDASQGFRDDASDGGYVSEGFSSGSTSAESSVRDYMYENGRRYHRFREGAYNFPNDDVEQEREDMKHAMVKLLCGQKLFFAPIGDNPQQILDIGTGTGIWVIEMGDQFPSASVLGIDLSPIQPDWLPPNVRFIVDDAESPWLYPRNHFDYIHSRHTVMALKDWMRLFRRALEHLKPGGWIELQEIHHAPRSANIDTELPETHLVAQFWSNVSAGLGNLGVDLNISSGGQLTKMLQEAGYVNVTERVFHVPIGTWPKNKVLKTVGLYWRTILLDGLQAIALGPMVRGLNWKREEVEVFLTSVRRAYHDNNALMYMPLHIIYAQKPENMG
ncbi:hypothetical protein V2A60_010191 [Cordyceps javanica]|uniref:Methyltransferase type 12 n=1 Tax=Cordyceps javanica TaxID=43265 RepID=A0A545VU62_9HYPO|nr:Methyltransferase type 12 [Cordyceps javanica]TQW05261.1 Methyltransferase type 12 [Cordyceps javanica]